MKKYIIPLFVFSCFVIFFFNFRDDETKKNSNGSSHEDHIVDESELRLTSSTSSPGSSISPLATTSSSYAISSSSSAFENKPWGSVSLSREMQNKVDGVIGNFSTPVVRSFVRVDLEFLENMEVDGIYDIPIPDAADADMHVTSIEETEGVTNVVGHLSGYPESYYIGFSYDNEGHVYGEITTEKSNYSIKTYYGQTVIVKVLPEMEKTQENDF